MPVTVTCAHDWVRSPGAKGPTNVVLACKLCGATSVSRGKTRGRTVTTTLEIYPPRGGTVLDPSLYEFFIRQWEAEVTALAHGGYTVDMRPPIVHQAARTGTKTKEPRTSKFATGRDVLIAAAIVLLGGVAMLCAGIYLDIAWMRTAGGVSLGVLVFLLLLVMFLST